MINPQNRYQNRLDEAIKHVDGVRSNINIIQHNHQIGKIIHELLTELPVEKEATMILEQAQKLHNEMKMFGRRRFPHHLDEVQRLLNDAKMFTCNEVIMRSFRDPVREAWEKQSREGTVPSTVVTNPESKMVLEGGREPLKPLSPPLVYETGPNGEPISPKPVRSQSTIDLILKKGREE